MKMRQFDFLDLIREELGNYMKVGKQLEIVSEEEGESAKTSRATLWRANWLA